MILLGLKIIDWITDQGMQEKIYQANKRVNWKMFKRISFCDGDLNKFVLLSTKGVYPDEYMDSWEKFDETWLPPKKRFLQWIKFRRY